MTEQIQHSCAPVQVQTAIANPDPISLNQDTAPRISLGAIVNRRRMRPRIAPELAAVLELKLEYLDWVSRSPCAHVWIGILGRSCCHRAILGPSVEGLTIGWIVLNSLDLVVDGDPPVVRRRHSDYIIAEI